MQKSVLATRAIAATIVALIAFVTPCRSAADPLSELISSPELNELRVKAPNADHVEPEDFPEFVGLYPVFKDAHFNAKRPIDWLSPFETGGIRRIKIGGGIIGHYVFSEGVFTLAQPYSETQRQAPVHEVNVEVGMPHPQLVETARLGLLDGFDRYTAPNDTRLRKRFKMVKIDGVEKEGILLIRNGDDLEEEPFRFNKPTPKVVAAPEKKIFDRCQMWLEVPGPGFIYAWMSPCYDPEELTGFIKQLNYKRYEKKIRS